MSDTAVGTAILEARDVVVRFGGLTALDDVSIEVPPASLIGLVGPNGAGKSTLFGVCSGLLRPNQGRVHLDGTDVTGASPQSRARLGMGRTFQQPEMYMGLTVRQHLVLAHRVRAERTRLWRDMFTGGGFRKPNSEETDRVDHLLSLLSLTKLADAQVNTLPLGTTRLVEVGRALASSPRVVMLDEPLSGLDANEARRLADALSRTVQDESISLLLVEHDVAMVLSLCSHIYVLDFGHLIAEGTPDDVRNNPAVKAAYLGDTPIGEGPHGEVVPSTDL
ncbi:MAG: ABC transporter ATP-binding protein [Acidimicrobiaceae bacterium]|nr:ABC transporter ATP-binding protein [Acidimicrobiaceae bacterium]